MYIYTYVCVCVCVVPIRFFSFSHLWHTHSVVFFFCLRLDMIGLTRNSSSCRHTRTKQTKRVPFLSLCSGWTCCVAATSH